MFGAGLEVKRHERLAVVAGVGSTLGAIAILVGSFAPWLRSGTTNRSSFELLDLVERLGFAEDGLFAWAVRLWPMVPLLVVAVVVATWVGHPRLAASLAMLAAAYVGAVVAGVSQARDTVLVHTAWGTTMSGVGALVMVVSGVGTLLLSRARRRG